MKKSIAIFTISEAVGVFYRTLLHDLFGELVEISSFSMEREDLSQAAAADLYLVGTTSSDMFDEVMSFIPREAKIVLSSITFQKKSLAPVLELPKGTRAMLVNLSANMAIETISELNRFGVTNVNFCPVYPGMESIPELDLAITPAEARFVPKGVSRVIDIGHRVLTANTVMEIALKLGFFSFMESAPCQAYFESLAEVDYSTTALASKSYSLENKFEILLEAVDVGVIGIDMDGVVFALNQRAERILMIEGCNVVGQPAFEGLPFLKPILKKEPYTTLETNLARIKGVDFSITIAPILRKRQYMGVFLLVQRFSDEENKQHKLRAQMLGRGYRSKYTFDDIIGESPSMLKAKTIAKKMARTDASILLTGESGTGKELFAHSIHNHSNRRHMSFVAINCAAIPDSLLESELFGYGDGAFTGAKKGGKLGLFEYAHRGTLFLDEIEGMSPSLQVKLLRVLQEKEVMRVGDNKMIPIDVRIIAATNENIRKMVENGTFRKDLYYRLNTLPIDIPPLRERGEDLFLIMEEIKAQIHAAFVLSETATHAFLHYPWDGNVRELRNIVEYLKFTDARTIQLEDLPEVFKAGESPAAEQREKESLGHKEETRRREKRFVLTLLLEAEEKAIPVGRKTISETAARRGMPLSEQEVRTILKHLEEDCLVQIRKGRGGSRITEEGRAFLRNENIGK